MTTNTPGLDILTLLANGAIVFLLLADSSPLTPAGPPDVPLHAVLLTFFIAGLIVVLLVLMVICSDRKAKIRHVTRRYDDLYRQYVMMQNQYIVRINELAAASSVVQQTPPPAPSYVPEPSIVTPSSRRFLRLH